jgi:hypothetical protein
MRGANGIDTVALHELEVSAHRLLVEGSPSARMPFVAVDPAEDDFSPVDGDDVPVNGDGPESDLHSDGLGIGGDSGVVEPGSFGGPRLHIGNRHLGIAGGGDGEFGNGHSRAVWSVNEEFGVTLPSGVDEKVVNAAMRPSQEGDFAEDA